MTKRPVSSLPTSSAFDLGAAVAETYAQFPHLTDSAFFIDVHQNAVIHPDENLRDIVTSLLRDNDIVRKNIGPQIKSCAEYKASEQYALSANGATLRFILLYLEPDMEGPLSSRATALHVDSDLNHTRYYTFDHELAHALIPGADAASAPARSESIADSYAALRHIQRFGADTGMVEKLMHTRAVFSFLAQDSAHFTSQAVETVIDLKGDLDIAALSLVQTASLARHIGTKNHTRAQDMRRLKYHFNKCAQLTRGVQNETTLRAFAEHVTTTRSSLASKWGQVALKALLDGKVSLTANKKPVSLTGAYWQKLRKTMTPASKK